MLNRVGTLGFLLVLLLLAELTVYCEGAIRAYDIIFEAAVDMRNDPRAGNYIVEYSASGGFFCGVKLRFWNGHEAMIRRFERTNSLITLDMPQGNPWTQTTFDISGGPVPLLVANSNAKCKIGRRDPNRPLDWKIEFDSGEDVGLCVVTAERGGAEGMQVDLRAENPNLMRFSDVAIIFSVKEGEPWFEYRANIHNLVTRITLYTDSSEEPKRRTCENTGNSELVAFRCTQGSSLTCQASDFCSTCGLVTPTTAPTRSPTTTPTVSPTPIPTTKSPTSLRPTTSRPTTSTELFLGCFPSSKAIKCGELLGVFHDMTISKCLEKARASSLKFACLQGGSFCRGQREDFSIPLDNDRENCDVRCPGNRSEICGGVGHHSVYQVLQSSGEAPLLTPYQTALVIFFPLCTLISIAQFIVMDTSIGLSILLWTSLLDFGNDVAYISTSIWYNQALMGGSIFVVFFGPTCFYAFWFREPIWKPMSGDHSPVNVTWNKLKDITLALKNKRNVVKFELPNPYSWLLFALSYMVLLLLLGLLWLICIAMGLVAVLLYLAAYFVVLFLLVNLKLVIFPSISKLPWTWAGLEDKFTRDRLAIAALSASVAAEVLFETIPQLGIVIYNTVATNNTSTVEAYVVTIVLSVVTTFAAVFPILYWWYKKDSFARSLDHDRYGILEVSEGISGTKFRDCVRGCACNRELDSAASQSGACCGAQKSASSASSPPSPVPLGNRRVEMTGSMQDNPQGQNETGATQSNLEIAGT